MRKRIVFAALLTAVVATGCQQTTLVKGGEPVTVADGAYSVLPSSSWARTDFAQEEFWTQNGPRLDRIVFYDPVEDGESLFEAKSGSDEDGPEFYADMSLLEVGEFIEASLTFSGLQDVRTTQLAAANFGGETGFRLEITAYTEGGLETKGFARGMIKEETLYLMTFLAPSLHYHDRVRDDAENMADSIELISERGQSAAPGV